MRPGSGADFPNDAPTDFVTAAWEPFVVRQAEVEPGSKAAPLSTIDRRFYELCVMDCLRAALRRGDVWVEGSRRYSDWRTWLIPAEKWAGERAGAYARLEIMENPRDFVKLMGGEIGENAHTLAAELTRGAQVTIENGEISVSRLAKVRLRGRVKELKDKIEAGLPMILLQDLLIEVDGWVGFSKHFRHPAGSESRSPHFEKALYATLVAKGCNIGLHTMSKLTPGLSYDVLKRVNRWYVHGNSLQKALVDLVNRALSIPIVSLFGDEKLSASDTQWHESRREAMGPVYHPRFFGLFGKGMASMTHLSDLNLPFYNQILGTERDATFLLDGLLYHGTNLPIEEHTSDTHGYTENVFALCRLFGFRFCPRIKDLPSQQLYRMEGVHVPDTLKPLLTRKIQTNLIVEHWDDIVRLVASLDDGHVRPSLLAQRMAPHAGKSALFRAVQEIGRAEKTQFILRYVVDRPLQRRILRALNKIEAYHALVRHLFFGKRGMIGEVEEEEQVNQMACLRLLILAIAFWNSVHQTNILENLRAAGFEYKKEDLKHITPLLYKHIIPYGEYRFRLVQPVSLDLFEKALVAELLAA